MKHRVRLALLGVVATAATAAALFAIAPSGAQQQVDICEAIESETEGEEFCALDIDKDRTSAATVEVGGSVTFEIEVTNTGTVDLTNIGVIDQYDEEIGFDSSNPMPSLPPDSGLAVWDGLDPNVLEPGESTTIIVTFDALEVTEVAENCALAFADVFFEEGDLQALQANVSDIETDFDCDEVAIESGGGDRDDRDPSPTPTEEPPVPSPTAIVTVAPATVVPQPSPTQPAGIVAPDTGDGPGSGGNGSLWLIAALLGSAALATGTGLRLVAQRTR